MQCYSGESITLQLQQSQRSICFDQPVLLICHHPIITAGPYDASRASWKEDGGVISINGGMYKSSATWLNVTEFVLVPKRSHFEPSGAHNYTCFLPLVEGGELESNPVQISPISKLLHIHFIHSHL